MPTTAQLIWIYKDSPVAAGELKSVKHINSDGWFFTVDKKLIDPHWCCPCTDWQEYNGGFALFEPNSERILETRDIKKYLIVVGDWVSEIAIASHLGLSMQQVRMWLNHNQDLVENREVRDGMEWRLKQVGSRKSEVGSMESPAATEDAATSNTEGVFSLPTSDFRLPTSGDNGSQKVTNCRRNDNGSQKVNKLFTLALDNAETLQDFEQLIRDNLLAFYTVGKALIEIRDRHLYIDLPDINTFEEYCKSPLTLLRLGIGSKSRAYQFIDAANIITILKESPLVTQLPSKEGQIRPMANGKLNAEQIVETWNEALEQAPSNKAPTGAIVANVVQQIKERTREKLKIENPYSKGDIARFNSCCDPQTRTRNKRWVIVTDVHSFSCTVADFEGEFVAHVDSLEKLELTQEEKQTAVTLRDRFSKIDTSQKLVKILVDYFARIEQFNLSELEMEISNIIFNYG